MTTKLTSLEQQLSKTQEALKEKENGVQKLQAQLKAAQGSFEQDRKKLEGQVAELKEVSVKKASSVCELACFVTAMCGVHVFECVCV